MGRVEVAGPHSSTDRAGRVTANLPALIRPNPYTKSVRAQFGTPNRKRNILQIHLVAVRLADQRSRIVPSHCFAYPPSF